ncbi:MAG: AAA family ATPase, partial [Chloroflexi bacterium]|nr:AAA family ATPase [Chloroflexota bacterium]
MRLTGINIENFGPFADREFGDMSGRLTLLHGPNEGGKSALRAFLRSTLFGYVTRSDRAALRELFLYRHFRPEAGSGSISLSTSSGANFNIHRRDGKKRGEVTITDDAPGGAVVGGDDLLRTLLGGIDSELYTNVFSISLSELQALSSLNSDEIRDKIYSVGLGLANVSLTDARSELDNELKTLRSPRAGRIRRQENHLAEARANLEETRRGSDLYAELSGNFEQVVENIDSQTAELEDVRLATERQKTLVGLRKPWERKTEIEHQISELPTNDLIPENAVHQLESLNEQKTDLQRQLDESILRQKEREQEAESVGVVEAFIEQGDAARKLGMETAYYNKAVVDLPDVEQELEKEQTQLDRDLAELGGGWTEQSINKFETPMDLQANLENAGRELTGARRIYQEHELTVQSRAEDRETMADEALKLAAARDALTDVPDQTSADLEKKRDRLARLRSAIADSGSVRSEMNDAQSNLADALAQSETEDIGGFVGSVLLPVTVVAVGIASMVWSYMNQELSGGLAGLLALMAGFMLISRARAAGGFKITIRKPALGEAKDVATAQVEEVQERLDAVGKEVSAIATEFNINDTPTIRDVEEKAGELERSLDLRRRFEAVAREFESAATRLANIDMRLTESHTALALASNTLADVQNRWQLLLERTELRIDLDPAQAANVMASIRTLKSQQRTVSSLRTRVAQMYDTIGEIEMRLTDVLEAAGLPDASPMKATEVLEDLSERLLAHDRAVERQKQITVELETLTNERENLEHRLGQVDGKIEALIEKGDTEDHEEFKAIA